MKNILYMKFLFAALTLAALMLISESCSNNSVSPVVTKDTLYYDDTLSVWIPAGISSNSTQSVAFGQTISASVVRLEFTVQSNADSGSGSKGSYYDTTNSSPKLPGIQNVYSAIDSIFTYTINVGSQPFYAGFQVTLATRPDTAATRYIRFKNIRVIKQQ